MSVETEQKKVCLTGCSGFLGSWVLKLCLERGWQVRATTTNKAKHEARLRALVPEKSHNFELFQCDLLTAGSFDEPMQGCDALLHTASPFFIDGATEDNVVKPAVQGTRNVLSAAKHAGITKVVLTSSTAAVYCWYGMKDKDHVLCADDWSMMDKMVEKRNWYSVSKTKAEKLAWEMSKELGLQLAVMNPCLIFGPMLQPSLNTSSGVFASYLQGKHKDIPNCTKCIVDVRDVAEAHLLALEKEAFGERYVLIGACPSWESIMKAIKAAAPTALHDKLPTTVSEKLAFQPMGAPAPHPTKFDNGPACTRLGLSFRSTEEMVKGTVESLAAHQLI